MQSYDDLIQKVCDGYSCPKQYEIIKEQYEIIKEDSISTFARMRTTASDGWIAVKSATISTCYSVAPHDIIKELRLLSNISHPNIINIMGSFRDDEQHRQHIYMPFLPISLAQILDSPNFTFHLVPSDAPDEACKLQKDQFIAIAKSLIFQVLCAVAFLHDTTRQIAHRDIKPGNIMLSKEGCVKLIDFGASFKNEPETEKIHDLWPEPQSKLYWEVTTRPYAAPELFFTRTYDPLAIDLWSLGATFAQFFTPIRLSGWNNHSHNDGHDDETGNDSELVDIPLAPFIVPKYLRIGNPDTQWTRDTLFNGNADKIALLCSIFSILGTPTAENWPEFEKLPGVDDVEFTVVPAVQFSPLLPNLPPSSVQSVTTSEEPLADFLQQFLRYPSALRLRTDDALRHPWFVHDESILLLPKGYKLEDECNHVKTVLDEWQGKSLEEWLHMIVPLNSV